MISETLQKIFDKKVGEIKNDRDRLMIFMYLCRVGDVKDIAKQFGIQRGSFYYILHKYKHLGIDAQYREDEWSRDHERQRRELLQQQKNTP